MDKSCSFYCCLASLWMCADWFTGRVHHYVHPPRFRSSSHWGLPAFGHIVYGVCAFLTRKVVWKIRHLDLSPDTSGGGRKSDAPRL